MLRKLSIFFIFFIFAIAGAYKLFTPQPFFESLKSFNFIPKELYIFIWLYFSILEILTAILIAISNTRIYGFFLAIILSIVFLLYRLVGILIDAKTGCGCLPFLSAFKFDLYGLGFNAIFVILIFVTYFESNDKRGNALN